MKVICCDCGVDLGHKDGAGADPAMVSHGYCKPCGQRFRVQLGLSLAEYFAEKTIGSANNSAMELVVSKCS